MVGFICFHFSNCGYASSIQRFAGFAFDNPANLSLIKNKQIKLELLTGMYHSTFTGSTVYGKGVARGESTVWPYYLRYVNRVSEKWVLSMDVTQPFIARYNYPADSIVRANKQYSTTSTDFSPNVSYQLNEKFALGGGIDVNYVTFDFQSVIGNALLSAKSGGWKTTWHTGFLSKLSPTFLVDVVFYSALTNIPDKGLSTLGDEVTRWSLLDFNLPAALILHAKKNVTSSFTLSGWGAYSFWKLDTLYFDNIAQGALRETHYNYKDTLLLATSGHYKINEKWSVQSTLLYEEGTTNIRDRSVTAASSDSTVLLLGVGYQLTPSVTVEFAYAHVYYLTVPIMNTFKNVFGSFASGTNVLDARFTWNF